MRKNPGKSDWIQDAVLTYERPLCAYALRIVGTTDAAQDVVQETFLRLCANDRRSLDGHLKEWLFTVCRTRAIDHMRKEKRMQPMTMEQAEETETHEPSPSAKAENKESLSRVMKAMKAIPKNQQEVIFLKFQAGMSYKQISSVTELSVTNVGYLIHTGLKTLRQQLDVA